MNEMIRDTPLQENAPSINLRNLLIGLWKRWPFFVAIILAACGLGVAGGLWLGERVYQSSTVLLYKSSDEQISRAALDHALETQVELVKLPTNLAEVRDRIDLPTSLEDLNEAIVARHERNTALITISAEWSSRETAADIARTLKDVFLENQQRIKKAGLAIQVRDLDDRLGSARLQFTRVEQDLQQFQTANKIIDLDTEAQQSVEELALVDRLYEQSRIERESADIQNAHFGKSGENLSTDLAEKSALSAELGDLASSNLRVQMISQAIQNDKEYQIRKTELDRAERNLEQVKKFKELGLISERDFEDALYTYEKQKALLDDTEEVKELKKTYREAMDSRLQRLGEARQKLKDKLDSLPTLQRQYAALQREYSFWKAQMQALEEAQVQKRREYESSVSDFNLISEAGIPAYPLRSTRRLFAIGIALLVSIVGFGVILAFELLDTSIRSETDVPLRLGQPVLGSVPKLAQGESLFAGASMSDQFEFYRIMARKIRQKVPLKGARILVVSATRGEGTTSVIAHLAACFGRLDERVLLVDAQVRPGNHQHELRELIANNNPPPNGLGEYLSFDTNNIADIIQPTRLPGVECIPRIGETEIPELLGSNRMREMLDELSGRFSLILIDTPPVLPYVDADLLAQGADAVVLVVGSRQRRSSSVNKAIDRLKNTQIPIAGVVLNQVDPLYMENT